MYRGVLISALLSVWIAAGSAAFAQSSIQIATPGASKELRRSLLGSSLLFQASQENVTDTEELLAAAQADYARLLGVLYENAHYGGVITILVDGVEAANIAPLNPPDRIARIDVQISAGPVYLFARSSVRPLATRTELPEEFAVGLPASTDIIRQAASAAVDGWRAQGHAKAEVADQRLVARHVDRRFLADLTIEPGPKLSFGDVSVTGNRSVRSSRILTIAGIPEGRTYDPKEIERATRRLRRTGSFRSVTIEEADTIGPDDTLPLTVSVSEQTPRRLALSAFWLHRNLLGGAERFRVDGEVAGLGGETGGIDYSSGIRFERPATPRADVDLYTSLTFEVLDEPDFKSDTVEFQLGFTRYATDDLVVNFGLGYLYSDVTDNFGQENYSLITLPLGATYERRDDALNPKDGYFVDLEMTPFHGLSGTTDGVQTVLDMRGYESFGAEDGLTFAARIQLGSLFGPDLLETPPIYRFFSGGGGTVRGQDYQSLARSRTEKWWAQFPWVVSRSSPENDREYRNCRLRRLGLYRGRSLSRSVRQQPCRRGIGIALQYRDRPHST